jgi:hypothetical protein
MVIRIFYLFNVFLGILLGCDETKTYEFFNGVSIHYCPENFIAIEAEALDPIFKKTFKIRRELAWPEDEDSLKDNAYTIVQEDLPWIKLNVSLPTISSEMSDDNIKKLIRLMGKLPLREGRISINLDAQNMLINNFYRQEVRLTERGIWLIQMGNIFIWEVKLWIDHIKNSKPEIGSADAYFCKSLQSYLRAKTPPPVF